MDLLHFEDFPVGTVREFGAWPVTKDEIVNFAREFDPQPFHLDEDAAKSTLLGGLATSGWHTGCIMMRLNCEEWALRTASMGGPGVEEMRWLKPVRPGDVLRCRMTVVGARVSKSRPEMGLVALQEEVLNQRDEMVMAMTFTAMLMRRSPGAPHADVPATQPEKPASPSLPTPVDADYEGRIGYYEDLVVGARIDLGTYTFERERMIAFATQWDPQRFHVDDAAAAASHFGKLSASGWHTSSAFMRRMVLTRDRLAAEMRAAGKVVPQYGPSPGIRDLRWPKPVYAGDVVRYSTMLVDKRPVSRPGWAVITSYNEGINQDGVKVLEYTSNAFCPRRPE